MCVIKKDFNSKKTVPMITSQKRLSKEVTGPLLAHTFENRMIPCLLHD